MKKVAIHFMLLFCLALAAGSALAHQSNRVVAGVWSDAPGSEPAVTPTPDPVVPEGQFIVNGMLSDVPALPGQPAVFSPSSPGLYDDGMPLNDPLVLQPDARQQDLPGASTPLGGLVDFCAPHSNFLLNFDEQSQPIEFIDTLALRYEYRSKGVIFDGPAAKDGGAILDQNSSYGVSGYSPPNFLAFNHNATLSDGGKANQPEQIYFLGKALYVELWVGSAVNAGQIATIQGFDDQNTFLGSASVALTAAMQPLSLYANHIYRVQISTSAGNFVVDNLAYIPEDYPLLVDFDDVTAPDLFAQATALRNSYWGQGVTFSGPATNDGGAILLHNSWAITGYSDPNILGFNTGATMSNGGNPRPPETIQFQFPVSFVQLYAGSFGGNIGKSLAIEAFNDSGKSLGSTAIALQSRMLPATLRMPDISKVVLTSEAVAFAVDDLIFIKQDAVYVDFDESSQPAAFANATALRNTYQPCGVLFDNPGVKDGGAILHQTSGFNVSGHSSPNFLAFNSGSTLSDGGVPRPPEEITFSHLVDSIQILVGCSLNPGPSTDITLQAFDLKDNFLGSSQLSMKTKMQVLGFHHPGISRVVILTSATRFVMDSLNIHFSPIIFLPFISKN